MATSGAVARRGGAHRADAKRILPPFARRVVYAMTPSYALLVWRTGGRLVSYHPHAANLRYQSRNCELIEQKIIKF